MANFIAIQSINVDESFLGEFVKASSTPDGGMAPADAPSVQTAAEAKLVIESYFAVPDSEPDPIPE